MVIEFGGGTREKLAGIDHANPFFRLFLATRRLSHVVEANMWVLSSNVPLFEHQRSIRLINIGFVSGWWGSRDSSNNDNSTPWGELWD